MPRLYALFATLLFFAFIGLFVREMPVWSNTIGIGWLAGGAIVVGAFIGCGIMWLRKQRFSPWERHLPEVLAILVSCMLFAPLLGSLLNRITVQREDQSFEFISETPYFASQYGILKNEKIQPTGYRLRVREGRRLLKFQYKRQAYFPLTHQGEKVLLPVRTGLLGFRVVELW